MFPQQKVILCILDGWGVSNSPFNNGIALAKTPHWDRMFKEYPHTQLQASELFVGLPKGQMGNSEVGHMTIGSGRLLMQDLPRIDQAIETNVIPTLETYQGFIQKAKAGTGVIHLLGLLSEGGIHSHQRHVIYMANALAEAGFAVKLHGFLDGRDTPPMAAVSTLSEFLSLLNPSVALASLGGRYYGMDRDQRWNRIESCYDAIVSANGSKTSDFVSMLQSFYDKGIGDEFVPFHVASDYTGMQDGDGLMMVNFRADRVRQILSALLLPDFNSFMRPRVVCFSATLGMMDYAAHLTPYMPALFVKHSIENTLGDVISKQGLKQLRLAETEKYAHVTFFFNGGRENIFPGEDRYLVPSPQVATYDLKPEMSAREVTDYLVEKIQQNIYDLIVVNFANPDMVGHTGVIPAIIKALEIIDESLGVIEEAAKKMGYAFFMTADHGNVEMMVDPSSGQPHTAHTLNPVPFVAVNTRSSLKGEIHPGTLQDIAPTVLAVMGLSQPDEMTGKSLIS